MEMAESEFPQFAQLDDDELADFAELYLRRLHGRDKRWFVSCLQREYLRRNPPSLKEWGYKYLSHYFTLPPSGLHEFLWERLGQFPFQRQQRISLIAPRDSGKTAIMSKEFVLWLICHGLARYVVMISDTESQSKLNLWAVKEELENNPDIARDYHWAAGQGPTWSETKIITSNGVMVEALGVGAKIRGRTKGEDRPDLIICDDLENDELVESPTGRENRRIWLQRAVVPALSNDGSIFIVGTALHPDDLIQHTAKTPGWEHHSFRALVSEPENETLWKEFRDLLSKPSPTQEIRYQNEEDARRLYADKAQAMSAGSEVLWPERESLLDLMILRCVIGEAAFQSEKQGNPVSAKTSEFADGLLRGDVFFENWPELTRRVLYCDPSKGKTERSDYSAIVDLGLDRMGYQYIEADLARRDVVQICEDILDHVKRTKPEAVGVEENGFEAIGPLLQRMAGERGTYLPLYMVRAIEGKRVRVRKWLTPPLRNRTIRFRSGSRGTSLLIQQLREFPTGQYDDGPDALAGAFQLMAKVRLGVEEDRFESADVG